MKWIGLFILISLSSALIGGGVGFWLGTWNIEEYPQCPNSSPLPIKEEVSIEKCSFDHGLLSTFLKRCLWKKPGFNTEEGQCTDTMRRVVQSCPEDMLLAINVLRDVKFLTEAPGKSHLDGRYYRRAMPIAQVQESIIGMLREIFRVGDIRGIQFVLMHGALIGWHWNKKLMPWDDDADVAVSHADLYRLHELIPLFHDRYELVVNPHFLIRDHQGSNVIDARFIDKETGVFVDITGLSPVVPGKICCKSPHCYDPEWMFPAIRDTFHDFSVYIPADYRRVLQSEYGLRAIESPRYRNWVFRDGEWKKG